MKKVIYFDNAATSFPKPPGVGEAMKAFIETSAGNPGRGGHSLSREAERVVDSARRRLARFLGVTNSSRIVFTLNATDALHLAIDGLLKPGDHVLASSYEHNSVVRPLMNWASKGVLVDFVDGCGEAIVDSFRRSVRSETRAIVCSHASNVSGTVMPVSEIADLARELKCLLIVDAAQSVGHIPLDIDAAGADFVAFSGHKGLMGPTGTGGLYVAESVDLSPVRFGGTGIHSESEAQPVEYPFRLESGTPNTAGIAGLDAALRFIEDVGADVVAARQMKLLAMIAGSVSNIGGVSAIGVESASRVPLISLVFDKADPQDVASYLDARFGIAVRAGLHCAPSAHRAFGTFPAGTLRISPGYFNNEDDVDILLIALKEAVEVFSK